MVASCIQLEILLENKYGVLSPYKDFKLEECYGFNFYDVRVSDFTFAEFFM